MAERLSASMRDRLDALVAVGDDDPHSPLHRIKTGSSNPSVGGMKRLLARLEVIEATGVLEIDVGWVNGNYQGILFHSVRTASADRGARDGGPRAGTSRWCASCTATASWSRRASTTCSRRNVKPSTGSFTATASSARCCSIVAPASPASDGEHETTGRGRGVDLRALAGERPQAYAAGRGLQTGCRDPAGRRGGRGAEVVVEVDRVDARSARRRRRRLQVQRRRPTPCSLAEGGTSTLRSRCARSRRPSPCLPSGRRASSSSETRAPRSAARAPASPRSTGTP